MRFNIQMAWAIPTVTDADDDTELHQLMQTKTN